MTIHRITGTDCYTDRHYVNERIRMSGDGKLYRVVAVKDNTITIRALRWYEKSWGFVIIIAVVMGILSVGVWILFN